MLHFTAVNLEQHGELVWIREGKRLRPADPEAYQAWLRAKARDVQELDRLYSLEPEAE